MKILVTGAAGFIGFHVARRLLAEGETVVSVDSVNPYYDPTLKEARLAQLQALPGFSFHRFDLKERDRTAALFEAERFDVVVHLAAQAGVRYSLTAPHAYIDSNLVAFMNILEGCRHTRVGHLAYASSSSVYGAEEAMPFSESLGVNHPLTLYAATKKSNEMMAHAYSHLFGLPTTGMRFFTVYGPWGRPDMALFIFTKAILEGRPIELFNEGRMARDFTYVDDIVEGVVRIARTTPRPNPAWDARACDPGSSSAPYRAYNIGRGSPVALLEFVEVLERVLGKKAERKLLPMQLGDVPSTHADISRLAADTGYAPKTPVTEGVPRFVRWYREFYGV